MMPFVQMKRRDQVARDGPMREVGELVYLKSRTMATALIRDDAAEPPNMAHLLRPRVGLRLGSLAYWQWLARRRGLVAPNGEPDVGLVLDQLAMETILTGQVVDPALPMPEADAEE